MWFVWIACGSDYDVKEGSPHLKMGSTEIDFGEVVVFRQETISVPVVNEGIATLDISGLPIVSPNPDIQVVSYSSSIPPGEEGELLFRFAPSTEGLQEASAQLISNDPDDPSMDINLVGQGVKPLIEVSPQSVSFGTVNPSETVSTDIQIQAAGSGTLRIIDILVSDSSFGYTLPEAMFLPIALDAGFGFQLDAHFTAVDDSPTSGQLIISSNDPTSPLSIVLLGANGGGSGDNQPPSLQIMSPPSGWQSMVDTPLTIQATIEDDQDAPESIPILVYWNSTIIDTIFSDAEGNIAADITPNSVANDTLLLRGIDSMGGIGEDSISLVVLDPQDPVPYIISGGPDIFQFWSVDDDIKIYVDGDLVFDDNNGSQDDLPPLAFMAHPGSTIRLVAQDENYCDQALSTLYLHFGVGQSQSIFDGHCLSACSESSCYEPTFSGPWPNTFVDETITVLIPE